MAPAEHNLYDTERLSDQWFAVKWKYQYCVAGHYGKIEV